MTELQALRELIGPRGGVDRDALERARAQIAEAQAYKRELGLIHAAVERTRNEMTALRRRAVRRASRPDAPRRELAAIVGGTERATQSILQAAEEIDQAADTLSARSRASHDQGLAKTSRSAWCRFSRPAIFRTSPASASPMCWRR